MPTSIRSFRDAADALVGSLRHKRREFAQRRAGSFCVQLRNYGQGFFAQLEWVLEILAYADEAKRTPQIRLRSPQYVTPSRGPDFFAYFFEPLRDPPAVADRDWHQIREIEQLRLPRGYDATLTVERAHALFFGRFRLRADIAAEIDAIARDAFAGGSALGVHYRGTDKKSEADRVPEDRMVRAIDVELERIGDAARLFIATDEQAFLDRCLGRYGSRVVSLPDHHRSTDGKPVFLDNGGRDGYLLGRDALFNCIMLSRCARVIKTASILSAWATVFNPQLDIRTLSRRDARHSYFPERVVPDYVFDDERV